MPKKENRQKGVSGYAKSKKRTLRELDEMLGEERNQLDDIEAEMEREAEEEKGITNWVRDIFK